MTEERKEELTQLLHEALVNLEIRCEWAKGISYLTVSDYRNHLLQQWDYSGPSILNYTPHIVNETTKLKLLDFIREELSEYIHEDRIQSACYFIKLGGQNPGYHLYYLLFQLMRITIARGVESAVAAFDRCATETHGSFQYFAILEGIKLESEILVYDGIRLVPLPDNASHLPRYLHSDVFRRGDEDKLTGKTLFIIDCFISPIFCLPSSTTELQAYQEFMSRFQVKVTNNILPNFDIDNFYGKFCQALSLVCNSNVQISRHWPFLPEDKLFNLESMGVSRMRYPSHPPFGIPSQVNKSQIDEVKRLYIILVNLNSGILKKLQISIDRWQKSKRNTDPVDKIIDLGIALEALYLSETDYNREIRFRFSLHAAWHLEKDKEQRKALMKEFKEIYDWRSTVVHTGKLPKKGSGKKKKPYTTEEVSEFITRAQDLCRDSILKILEDGEFPDWNDLILG